MHGTLKIDSDLLHGQQQPTHWNPQSWRAVLDQVKCANTLTAVAAFRDTTNADRVRNFGPTFVARFSYFAGYEADTPGPRPLILDNLVRRALSECGGHDSDRDAVPHDTRVTSNSRLGGVPPSAPRQIKWNWLSC